MGSGSRSPTNKQLFAERLAPTLMLLLLLLFFFFFFLLLLLLLNDCKATCDKSRCGISSMF